jgi:hypothetical protein
MNKLPIALLVGAMAMTTGVLAAEQDKTAKPTPKDCAKLGGKEKDKCIQATPAGPVDMQTGAQKKGKSEIAKDRDQAKEKADNQAGTDAPAQGNDAVGHPAERSATGEAQTGTTGGNSPSGKTPAEQSKDSVGHPNKRRATGEAQSGQEPSENVAKKTQ